MGPWFFWHRQSVTTPIIKSFFEILRTENPDLKIAVAGFCWGGRYAILLGQENFADQPLVDAVFAGHPSLISFPKDLENPVVPTSIAVAEIDRYFDPKIGDKVKEMWEKKKDEVKTEIVVYEGVKHGFCVRGDLKNETVKTAMQKAADQVHCTSTTILIFGSGLVQPLLVGMIGKVHFVFAESRPRLIIWWILWFDRSVERQI